MAYSAVPTKSTGDLWTAADNNTYIRDNFAASVPDIFTAKGDLAVASAADVAGALAVGANGTILTAASGESLGLEWGSSKGGEVAQARYKISSSTANAGFASGSTEIVDFDTSVFDPDAAVTTGASWKYTVPASKGGYYLVCGMITLVAATAWGENEYVALGLYVNGSLNCYLAGLFQQSAASSGYAVSITGATVINLSAADYIDLRIYQNSGSAININTSGDWSHVSIIKFPA